VYPLEKFTNLSAEKQKIIIDAALNSFGTNGYKKSSISDIAAAAGISKAMIFHYFGTKKALYFYLIEFSSNIVINEINKKFDNTVTDFFERIKLATNIEISAVKKHPAILSFLNSLYLESDNEVKEDIKAMFAQSEGFRNKLAFDCVDYSKFKDAIDLKIFMKMFSWIAEGYTSQLSTKKDIDLDLLGKEFDDCLNLLKNNFYKEEFL
jgi:AcrR family transcriptional regulator